MPSAPVDTAYPGVAKHALIVSFVDAILGRGEADVTAEDIFRCMEACLVIDAAAARRKVVSAAAPAEVE